MKKFNFAGLIFLILLSVSVTGCRSQEQFKINNNTVEITRNDTENDNFDTRANSPKDQEIFEENKEKDNTEIDRRYKEVDKSKLDYNTSYSANTYYETKDSIVGSHSDIPRVDNKLYKDILKDYTYASEVNPIKISYEDSIKLAKM